MKWHQYSIGPFLASRILHLYLISCKHYKRTADISPLDILIILVYIDYNIDSVLLETFAVAIMRIVFHYFYMEIAFDTSI